jgi:DNA processing protein
VGSRDASERGLARARALAGDAARAGAVVVSGGARGVDLAAHAGALAAGGETVFVLGDPIRGADDERPTRVRERMAEGRALSVTAHGPWTPMTSRLWVARNAVLAALCDAVLVVEGRARSGTRHTAEAAVALGLPLLVVPGDPEEDLARTPNALLKLRGARPLLAPEDALEALFGAAAPPAAPAQPPLPLDLAPGPRRLLDAVRGAGGAATPDDLARALGVSPAGLLADAFDLELRGLLARAGACWRVT